MTQAFYTAIGGMSAGQTKMTVVADNIANMNTIGFKASTVNFSDVFYGTSSTGQSPSGRIGGTNPKQIGIGVKTASIARNFTAGTNLSTGLNTDLCINGSSFFTVASPTVEILYTRDGNFTVDANGNLVTSAGYKVLGTEKSLNTTASTIPIKVPTYINTVTTAGIANKDKTSINDLNSINSGGIKDGDIKITYGDKSINVTVNGDMTVSDLINTIQSKIDETGSDLKDKVVFELIEDPNSEDLGKFQIRTSDASDTTIVKMENVTSNLVTQMGFAMENAEFKSDVVNYTQSIGLGIPGDVNSQNYTDLAISENGIITVKYGNNDTLSVMQSPDDANKMIFKYTLNDGTIITNRYGDLDIKDGLVEAPNFQIQFASFVNPNGLVASGNNTYTTGPNSGFALYGSINSTAFGSVQSGVLESSNVDLASQFADMIVSQRAIEANSRVFDTTNQILQTLSRLGQ